MNIDKTEGVCLGRNKDKQETPFGIKWPKEPVKLSVYIFPMIIIQVSGATLSLSLSNSQDNYIGGRQGI